MVKIQWPASSSPGERPQEAAGRLVNAFAENRGEQQGNIWHRFPGASIFGGEEINEDWVWWSIWEYFLGTPEARPELDGIFRGAIIVADTLWVIAGERIYTFSRNGDATSIGTLAGTSRVFLARNNKTPVADIVAVTEEGGAFIITSSGAATYPDIDVGSPVAVTGHEGYFFFEYGNGDIQASDLNSTNLNTLNSAAAESNPDGLLRGWSYEGYYYAAGPTTIEVFGPPVNDEGFPYNRVGYHITPGLLTAWAVAGFDPEFGHPPLYVATDRTVRRLQGTTAEHISPPDLDKMIAAVADVADIDCLGYVVQGVAWFQVNGPSFSWAFNLNTEKWTELVSQGLTRSRRVGSVYAFDMWLVGDTQGGRLLIPDSSNEEAGEVLLFWMESIDVKAFPNRTRVDVVDFDFIVGQGIATSDEPNVQQPTVRMQYSNDGGRTWSKSFTRDLGAQADSKQRITLNNTGLTGTQGRRWRILLSDPVHAGFLGATQNQKVHRDRRRT